MLSIVGWRCCSAANARANFNIQEYSQTLSYVVELKWRMLIHKKVLRTVSVTKIRLNMYIWLLLFMSFSVNSVYPLKVFVSLLMFSTFLVHIKHTITPSAISVSFYLMWKRICLSWFRSVRVFRQKGEQSLVELAKRKSIFSTRFSSTEMFFKTIRKTKVKHFCLRKRFFSASKIIFNRKEEKEKKNASRN